MTTLRRIGALLTPAEHKRSLTLIALTLGGMVLETAGIGLVIPAISLLTRPEVVLQYEFVARAFGPDAINNPSRVIGAGMALLVITYAIKNLFLAFLAWWQVKFVWEVQARLSQELFSVYLNQPYAFHLRRNSAQLIRNATTEVQLFAGVMTNVMTLLGNALVLLGISALLLVVEPAGTLIVTGLMGGAALVFYRVTHRRVTQWGQARQHHEGLRLQHLQQGLGGVKEVKLYGRVAAFLAEYWAHNREVARVSQRQQTLLLMPHLWMELLAVAGLALLVVTMLMRGYDVASTIPALGLFTAAAFRLMPLANQTLNAVQSLRYGLPVVAVLHDELSSPVGSAAGTEPRETSPAPLARDLGLRDVTYTYDGASRPALRNLSLTIRRNECVGFVGLSGAGKSTLIDVLLGLLTPDSGTVEVDGRDIQLNLRAWQDQVGYVPQTIFLTDDTLRRNVAFGLPPDAIDDQAVRRAISAAQLDDFVANLPDGVETRVGERGVRLSGGQRQRIGIARALYHAPAVLVMDEATSALDSTTEDGVMAAVSALRGTKTILIVAHRKSTVERCDRIVRLEDGTVAGEGSPLDLLANGVR